MTKIAQKQLAVRSFGTEKAKRKEASRITNRVEDEGQVGDPTETKRRKKGTGDDRLQEMAEKVVD